MTGGWLIHDTWADTLIPSGYTAPVWVGIYYSGSWHDISADVNELDGITISRGRPNEGSQPDPARCQLTLKNPTGTYSPRNPNSPLYGLIGRNTPIRVFIYVGGVWYPRFQGEVVSWPQTWGTKGSAQSFAPIECAGIMRRLGQGASPLRSPIYRALSAIGSNLVGYWPCEDSVGSTSFAVGVGTRPGRIIGSPTLAEYAGFVASSDLPKVGSSRWSFILDRYANTTKFQVRFLANIPAATPNNSVLCRIWTDNSLGWMDLIYGTGGSLKLQPYTNLGVATTAIGPIAFLVDGKNLRIDIEATKNGAGIDFTIATLEPGATSGAVGTGNVASATLGSCTRVDINPDAAAMADLAIGHVTVEKAITSVFDIGAVLDGYEGEKAVDRLSRLTTEAGITLTTTGDDGRSAYLGVQRQTDLVSLLQDAAEADHGVLFETRSSATALTYRPAASFFTQTTADCTVAYTDNLLVPFEPVDDDEATRNRVTVTREGGTSATVEDATSALGTSSIGVYDESKTLLLGYDIQARHQAGWLVHLGTANESRWPQVGVDLAHPSIKANTALRAALLGLDIGDRLDVTSLPSWLPPDSVQALVQGYTEKITAGNYKIVFNATPFRPWRVARWKDTGITDRYSNENTTTGGTMTTTATSLSASFSAGPQWTHADGDFDIMVAGERMTVTAVSGTSSPQTFTVIRSVNGVVKSHAAGEAVTLADPVFYGM